MNKTPLYDAHIKLGAKMVNFSNWEMPISYSSLIEEHNAVRDFLWPWTTCNKVNLAEKIDRILENKVPFEEVASYYFDFTIYFANLLFPLFLFLSVIWFTSKLANNTEVVAFLSSGVSFSRFLRPYFIGGTIIALIALMLGMYWAPKASKGFNEFTYKYLKNKNWNLSDYHKHIDKENRLLRPLNLFEPSPGKGFEIYNIKNDIKAIIFLLFFSYSFFSTPLDSLVFLMTLNIFSFLIQKHQKV